MTDRHLSPQRNLRASPAQWTAWLRAAKRAGLSLSEWIRAALDAAARR
jgi:predicted HicB family RNase H-like nuclease